jgi:pantothenate kinase type III
VILEIGNTRCKWLLNDTLYFSSYNSLELLQKNILNVPLNQTIYYSSVSKSRFDSIQKLFPEKSPSFVDVRSLITTEYVRNYASCINIGSDRLFGALGARKHTKNAILSIDCGTATTINYFTAENVFQGGMIFPGYMTQKNSLHSNTSIPSQKFTSIEAKLQLNTADAIHSGIVSNTCGAIQIAIEEIQQVSDSSLTIVLTGGNYHYFSNKLLSMGISHLFDPFLVLRGIASVIPKSEQNNYNIKH